MEVRITNRAVEQYLERIGPLPAGWSSAKCRMVAYVEESGPPPPAILRKAHGAAKHVAVGRICVYHETTRALFVVVEHPGVFLVVTVLRPNSKRMTGREFRAKEMQRMHREGYVKGYA